MTEARSADRSDPARLEGQKDLERGAEGDEARRQVNAEINRRFTAKMDGTMCSVLNPVAHYQWTEDFSCRT